MAICAVTASHAKHTVGISAYYRAPRHAAGSPVYGIGRGVQLAIVGRKYIERVACCRKRPHIGREREHHFLLSPHGGGRVGSCKHVITIVVHQAIHVATLLHGLLLGHLAMHRRQCAVCHVAPLQRVRLHLVHVHLHVVCAVGHIVECRHFYSHLAGKVDGVFVAVGKRGVAHTLGIAYRHFHRVAAGIRQFHKHTRYVGTLWQRVGVVYAGLLQVDGEEHRV